MKNITLLLVFALLISFSASSLACSFDTDCRVGSKCHKAQNSLYGVCIGGLYPGNKYDDNPVEFFPDINKTHGDTCSFDTDCGSGSKCLKGSGSIYGTCFSN